MIKGISEKPLIILNGKRLKAFLSRTGAKLGYLTLPLLFMFTLVLAKAIRLEKEIKNTFTLGIKKEAIRIFK